MLPAGYCRPVGVLRFVEAENFTVRALLRCRDRLKGIAREGER